MARWILSIACVIVSSACHAADDAGVTIVGRGGAAQEVGKGGSVREVSKGDLQFRNQSRVSSETRRSVSSVPEKPRQKQSERKPDAKQAEPAEKELTPEEKARIEAIKKENVEKIRKVRLLGGAFSDKEDQPLSDEELDRRIKEGELDDIKMFDKYQGLAETKSDKEPGQTSSNQTPTTTEEKR